MLSGRTKKVKKFIGMLIAAIMICLMLPLSAAAADTIDAYPYPGNFNPKEGNYYVRNVETGGYLAAEKVGGEVRYHIQDKGDLFQITKFQIVKGKEDVYAFKFVIEKSPVATKGHSLKVASQNGWPAPGTEITEMADYNLWHQFWAFDEAGNGQFYIRSYLDNSTEPGKGIDGTFPYLDVKSVSNDKLACLYAYAAGRKSQLWVLEEAITLNGQGLENDPYIISTADDLDELAYVISRGQSCSGVYFKLTDDITYNNTKIGTESCPFSGIFDGGGHTITVNIADGSYTGLFASLNGATVKNLKIKGTVSGTGSVGGVAGYACNKTVIENCLVSADVSGTDGNIGGIVGLLIDGTISKCRMDGDVTNTGWTSTGGIVGGIIGGGNIYNCVNTGKITADKAVGGILGCVIGGDTLIGNCSSLGSTAENSANGGYEHGGIVGFIGDETDNCTIANSFSKCDIGVARDSGHIIGNNMSTDGAIAYYIYYTAAGKPEKVIGTGNDFVNARKNLVYEVAKKDYSSTLQKLNSTAKGYTASGYDFTLWTNGGDSLYPQSCSLDSSLSASVFSEKNTVALIVIAAVILAALVLVIVLCKTKKKKAK